MFTAVSSVIQESQQEFIVKGLSIYDFSGRLVAGLAGFLNQLPEPSIYAWFKATSSGQITQLFTFSYHFAA